MTLPQIFRIASGFTPRGRRIHQPVPGSRNPERQLTNLFVLRALAAWVSTRPKVFVQLIMKY